MRGWELNDILPTFQGFYSWKVGSTTSVQKSKQALFLKPETF
jgi:hypothetical protein